MPRQNSRGGAGAEVHAARRREVKPVLHVGKQRILAAKELLRQVNQVGVNDLETLRTRKSHILRKSIHPVAVQPEAIEFIHKGGWTGSNIQCGGSAPEWPTPLDQQGQDAPVDRWGVLISHGHDIGVVTVPAASVELL